MARFDYIDTPAQLQHACASMRCCRVLCVDTEFHRENTYYPEFALLQIYGRGQCWIIDPLALDDLAPVWDVLLRPDIVKVFHAARQDLEIIFRASGSLPLPLFDTQIAAALLGFGQQIGFANLVQRLLKKTLGKQESFSDWKHRPLTSKQLAYAADDVIWLMPCYQALRERLQARGRLEWLDEEQRALCDANQYREQDATLFWRVKGATKLKGAHLAALRELAAWREREARRCNIPRRRLLPDESLVEIARCKALNRDQLRRIRGLNDGIVKRFGEAIMLAWQSGIQSDAASWPKPEQRKSHAAGSELRCAMLDALVRIRAESDQISPHILAAKSDLMALASWGRHCRGEPPQVSCLQGWRHELIGRELLQLLRGEICLSLDPGKGKPVVHPIDNGDTV
ncbi:MAG: ribonuclease D [Zetaproteobacteria bacterium]|nr:MAG: ribonuclease D [Zetaproteobacteria bacterium]